MAAYRINYGNGQVSETMTDPTVARREYARTRAELYGEYARLQRYEVGSADEPGDWFTMRTRDSK